MIYTDADIFLDAITLLLHVNDTKSQLLVTKIINMTQDKNQHLNKDDKLIAFYKTLAGQIMQMQLTMENPTELAMLLIKFKSSPAVQENEEAYNQLHEIFTGSKRFTDNNLDYIVERLQNTVIWHQASAQVRRMFGAINRCEDTTDPTEQRRYLDEVLNSAKEIQLSFTESVASKDTSGLVEHIDFTNPASISTALDKFVNRKMTNAMRLGLQGLNRMFGRNKGPTLGESIIFNARCHNFKSGMLMSIAKWIIKYNVPPTNAEGKKPLIIFITLENEGFENLVWWFRSVYETTFNKSSDGVPSLEIIEYVHSYFNERGYTFIVERYLPSEFGYEELVSITEKYENMGYFFVATIIDYVNNMKKSCSNSKSSGIGNHLLVRELYSNICNYTKSKGIAMFTAHQFNRGADELASRTVNAVKKFNASHLADSTDPQREADTSINLNIEKNQQGESFLTMYRTKRRYDNDTPEIDKYTAYKFGPYGITDDVEGADISVQDIHVTMMDKACAPQSIDQLF